MMAKVCHEAKMFQYDKTNRNVGMEGVSIPHSTDRIQNLESILCLKNSSNAIAIGVPWGLSL